MIPRLLNVRIAAVAAIIVAQLWVLSAVLDEWLPSRSQGWVVTGQFLCLAGAVAIAMAVPRAGHREETADGAEWQIADRLDRMPQATSP
ncbi:MAG TPA: hypothetical protein VET24_13040 [Actinomycetota bacterium]|nr:hypothetical protein [Actinomycetota bacterium]